MKKLFVGIVALLFVGGILTVPAISANDKKAEQSKHKFECPNTHMNDQDQCLKCHTVPDFKLKEVSPNNWREMPYGRSIMDIISDNSGSYGIYYMGDISHDSTGKTLLEFFQYLERHQIFRAVIDIQSFGGSLFEGWRCKSVIDEFLQKGFDIQTKVRSIAASAATLIFLAPEKRLISPTAELMFHELWTFDFLKISSPSDKEDEAKILRHLQSGMNEWIATRGKITKDEIDEKVRKKEFWVRGSEAIDYGFATGYIGK